VDGGERHQFVPILALIFDSDPPSVAVAVLKHIDCYHTMWWLIKRAVSNNTFVKTVGVCFPFSRLRGSEKMIITVMTFCHWRKSVYSIYFSPLFWVCHLIMKWFFAGNFITYRLDTGLLYQKMKLASHCSRMTWHEDCMFAPHQAQ
jgi:hypothetical protein